MMNRHVAEVENLYRQMRGWRHDYHNHIQMMKAYRALGQDDRLDVYLDELEQDLKGFDVLIRSGNVMIDAVLNSSSLWPKATASPLTPKRLSRGSCPFPILIYASSSAICWTTPLRPVNGWRIPLPALFGFIWI